MPEILGAVIGSSAVWYIVKVATGVNLLAGII